MQFPLFPEGVTHITVQLAFARRDGQVTYFNGDMPLFIHEQSDLASFRMISAQFVLNGCATQAQIARAFGVAKISIKRAVKRYREQGPKGFYVPKRARGPAVLTAAALAQAQRLFDEQLRVAEVAERLGIKRDTLSKAVRAGRLQLRARVKSSAALLITNKSERTLVDSAAPMGMGALNVLARMAASVGALDAVAPQFVPALDVPCGGVLFALPALLALGLIGSTPGFLQLPKGYYGLDSVMVLLAFMALARARTQYTISNRLHSRRALWFSQRWCSFNVDLRSHHAEVLHQGEARTALCPADGCWQPGNCAAGLPEQGNPLYRCCHRAGRER